MATSVALMDTTRFGETIPAGGRRCCNTCRRPKCGPPSALPLRNDGAYKSNSFGQSRSKWPKQLKREKRQQVKEHPKTLFAYLVAQQVTEVLHEFKYTKMYVWIQKRTRRIWIEW